MRRGNSATAPALAVVVLALSSCGGGGDEASTSTTAVSTTTTRSTAGPAGGHESRGQPPGRRQESRRHRHPSTRAAVKSAVAQTKPARLNPRERHVADAIRGYVAALDARAGAHVCASFVPGALRSVRFPRGGPACASSVAASIGYRDPRGFPVYRHSRVARIRSVAIDAADARVVATLVTQFAGDREPSVEDDIVYVTQRGGRWLIAKPSAVLYRAIGVGDIPPSVLAAPR